MTMMKKGGLQIALDNLIGLIVASVIILALVFFVTGLLQIISPATEQSTLDNFDMLVFTINQLVGVKNVPEGGKIYSGDREIKIETLEEGKKFTAKINYYLPDNFGIAGFDSDVIHQTCGIRNKDMKRPNLCTSLPCICLAKLENNFINPVNDYKVCKSLSKVKYISTTPGFTEAGFNYGELHPTGDSLAIWSGCTDSLVFRGPIFNVRNINIIRQQSSNEADKFDIVFDLLPK